jgi:D-sedoheptulose 7-phosphate isomerase
MSEWKSVLAEHRQMVDALDGAADVLDAIAITVTQCLRAACRVYLVGNGGSAADAQHIAAELLGRFKQDRLALPALALTTDSSTLTAIGNDLGYENIFSRQLEGLLQNGDVVWLLSTSGNSPNILKAADMALQLGITRVGFTGRSGGKLAGMCDLTFRAPAEASERIQEAHMLAYHYICGRVEEALA